MSFKQILLKKIVLGDFNAKTGKENIYKLTIGSESLHETMNDNGNKFITFATVRNMIISNTHFPHKNIHKTNIDFSLWINKKPNRSHVSGQPDKIVHQ